MKTTQPTKPVATAESKNEPTKREQSALHQQRGKRPRPSRRTQPTKPATASKNEPTLHQQGEKRPRRARRWSTVIDDDWTQLERRRASLKRALLPWVAPTDHGTNTTQKTETVPGSKYQPTPYEQEVLAKQAQRLKDQVVVPRIKFVEDQHGGRREFDHPDQATALALLKEAFGTANDQFAYGLLSHLCTVLPVDERSAFEYPRADDVNNAIALVAAGKPVDEFHAAILVDWAVCRILIDQLLHNMRQPMRFDLSDELKFAVLHYQYGPKDQLDREVIIERRPVLEFCVRSVAKLMTTCLELTAAANRYRATVEPPRKLQQLPAVMLPNAAPKKTSAARARRLNGSAATKLPPKTTMAGKGNGHTPT